MTTPPAQGRPPAAGSILAVCPRSRTGHPAAPPLARAAAGCRLAHRPPLLTAMLSGVSAPASLTRETAPSQMDTAAQRILLHHIRPRQIAAATAARHSCRGSASRHWNAWTRAVSAVVSIWLRTRAVRRAPRTAAAGQQTLHACARHLAGASRRGVDRAHSCDKLPPLHHKAPRTPPTTRHTNRMKG